MNCSVNRRSVAKSLKLKIVVKILENIWSTDVNTKLFQTGLAGGGTVQISLMPEYWGV